MTLSLSRLKKLLPSLRPRLPKVLRPSKPPPSQHRPSRRQPPPRPLTNNDDLFTALGDYPDIFSRILDFWNGEPTFVSELHELEQRLIAVVGVEISSVPPRRRKRALAPPPPSHDQIDEIFADIGRLNPRTGWYRTQTLITVLRAIVHLWRTHDPLQIEVCSHMARAFVNLRTAIDNSMCHSLDTGELFVLASELRRLVIQQPPTHNPWNDFYYQIFYILGWSELRDYSTPAYDLYDHAALIWEPWGRFIPRHDSAGKRIPQVKYPWVLELWANGNLEIGEFEDGGHGMGWVT